MCCKINLVDYKQITAFYSQPLFSWILVSTSNIYYVNEIICKSRTKSSHDIVTTTFNDNQIKTRIFLFNLLNYCQIYCWIFTYSSMWTSASSYSDDHIFRHNFQLCR